jgi:hypothetical protein
MQLKNKQVNKWQPIKRCSLNKIKIKTKGPKQTGPNIKYLRN